MSRVIHINSDRIGAGFIAVIAALVLLTTIGVSLAEATTQTYCSNCLVPGANYVKASTANYITSDHVHRIDGTAGTTIAAAALYTDTNSWSSYLYTTGTDATHTFDGLRPAKGAVFNLGGASIHFDADVSY